MSKEVHRIYFCKDGAILDTQIREGEDVTDTLKRCFKKIADLEAKLADTEAQNKRVLEKLDLIIRSNQELEKENQQLKDKLHTSEQETMHFQNKYFAEKQIAIEELNKVKELLLSKAIQITGTSVDGVRLYSINEIFSNQIKQLKEMK